MKNQNISINEKLSSKSELLIFDSDKLQNTSFIIKYLPLLSKHFSRTVVYSGNYMLNFWVKICAFFPNIRILPLQDFTEDFSHYGIIINLDENREDFKSVYANYLVLNIHKEENFNILSENELNSNQDKLNNLCKLLNLDTSLLDDTLVLQMIDHFYPCQTKNNDNVFLLDNKLNELMLKLILEKRKIPHLMIKALPNNIKHRSKDMHDLDTILIVVRNAEVFYTDNTNYYEFFSHPMLDIKVKMINNILSCLSWLTK